MPLRYLKSRAKYLIRFDDFCPTMNWSVWSRIEAILLSEGIRPLVAIVPDNLDKKLEVGEENPRFWERARYWQELGWTIALHGYQHRYVNKNGGILASTARASSPAFQKLSNNPNWSVRSKFSDVTESNRLLGSPLRTRSTTQRYGF